MRFSKWHALGNSYLVVERDEAGELTQDRVRRLCNVDLGIGADGVLEVVSVKDARADVVIWNPDGSTAEMSGNGTRIAARWLADRIGAAEVVIGVGPREVAARMIDGVEVETDVGPVEVGTPETIDVHGNVVELTPVSVGNPHAVVRCEEPAREVLLRLGPLIETHARFPERTNVQLACPEGEHEVRALVWERGAGETAASGSSAVAVAAAAVAGGWSASPVTVRMSGGDLVVRIDGEQAILVGPAELICTGETTFWDCALPRTESRRSIDHVTLRVSDFAASRHFYSTVLAPLGIELGWEDEVGMAEWGDFSIAHDGKPVSRHVHVAFVAASQTEVDAFHRAGVEAGFGDNGPPGERPAYHPGYYGAFLLDPDGNNVEAVFHDRS